MPRTHNATPTDILKSYLSTLKVHYVCTKSRLLFYFNHLECICILYDITSWSTSSFLCKSDQNYFKNSLTGDSVLSNVTISSSASLSLLELHFIYSVLIWISLKPQDSNVCLHRSYLPLNTSLVSSTSNSNNFNWTNYFRKKSYNIRDPVFFLGT